MEKSNHLPISNWASEDRPREKFMLKGIQSLTNAELLAIILGSGTKNESAVELAQKILNLNGNNLNSLGKMGMKELTEIKGVGPAKAISIIATLELGKRRKAETVIQKEKITCSADAAELFRTQLSDLSYEEFWILLLNRSNKIINRIKISQGGIAGTVIDVKIILKYALDQLASSLIIGHNHPSGNLNPSESDRQITKKIQEAAQMIDVKLLDHIIIADSAYFSFADEGIM